MLILLTSILQQSAEAWANKEDMFQGCRVLDLLAAGDKTSGLELSFVWNNSFAVKYVCIAIYLNCMFWMGRGGGEDKNTQGLNSMSHRSENYPWIVYDFRLVETEDRASDKR